MDGFAKGIIGGVAGAVALVLVVWVTNLWNLIVYSAAKEVMSHTTLVAGGTSSSTGPNKDPAPVKCLGKDDLLVNVSCMIDKGSTAFQGGIKFDPIARSATCSFSHHATSTYTATAMCLRVTFEKGTH
jgi:hypothetical protein